MKKQQEQATFMIEDTTIMPGGYRNFGGKATKFNPDGGKKTFCLVLPEDAATQLLLDGWAVKYTEIKEDGDVATPFITVEIGYKIKPPRVVMISDGRRTNLDEDTVEILDWANIISVDCIARAYDWSAAGKEGRKAYAQSLFVTIEEDALERKYAMNEVPE